MEKEITIYDIADKLNLSTATISRALANNTLISEATRKRVHAAAEKLGYRHNNFASNLRKQKSHTVGVIVHELRSSFIISVLAGIEKVVNENKYNLIITHSAEQMEKEVANANNLFHQRVDGIIASLSFATKNLDHFQQFDKKNIPIIFFDRVEEKSNFIRVTLDNKNAGYLATKHLLDQGCKRIAMITSPLTRNVYAQRFNGYKKALAEKNIEVDKKLLIVNDLSENSGIEAAAKILQMKPRPDGIFVTNDFVAAVCMHELIKNGVNVPKDIAIVGFNNDAISKIVQPELTTISYPGDQIGELAARALFNVLAPGKYNGKRSAITLDPELIVRRSSIKKG